MVQEPFLVKFARILPSDDKDGDDIMIRSQDRTAAGKVRKIGTIFTKVDRETTDDQ